MRVVKKKAWLASLAVALVATLGSGATAQSSDLASNPLSTDRSGSIVIFPKVIADGTRDTLIELTNTSNGTAYAHCVYVNGVGRCRLSGGLCTAGGNPAPGQCPSGVNDICDQACTPLDFDVVLTRQQPTIWRVSTGRTLNPLDNDQEGFCANVSAGTIQDCPGFDPGLGAGGVGIPFPAQPFRGELKCVQVGVSGEPSAANSLKGEATLETLGGRQISRYNSLNFFANPARPDASRGVLDADESLELNGDEYSRCPTSVQFIHHANGAVNDVAANLSPTDCDGAGCSVTTEVTVVPCTQNPEGGVILEAPVQLDTINEFEQLAGSSSFTIGCWANLDLSEINPGPFSPAGGQYRKTNLRGAGSQNVCRSGGTPRVCVGGTEAGASCVISTECDGGQCRARTCTADADCGASGVCGPATGYLVLVEEFYSSDSGTSSAAQNAHLIGQRAGVCQGNLATPCESDCDCNGAGNCDGPGRCLVDAIVFDTTP